MVHVGLLIETFWLTASKVSTPSLIVKKPAQTTTGVLDTMQLPHAFLLYHHNLSTGVQLTGKGRGLEMGKWRIRLTILWPQAIRSQAFHVTPKIKACIFNAYLNIFSQISYQRWIYLYFEGFIICYIAGHFLRKSTVEYETTTKDYNQLAGKNCDSN